MKTNTMAISLKSKPKAGAGFITLLEIYQRAIALVLLAFALRYWAMIIGFPEEGGQRYDLMENHWRVASASLCVLFPVAAIGLWGLFAWGALVWLMCIVIEIAMYFWFSNLFGSKEALLAFHLLTFIIFLAIYFMPKIIQRIQLWRKWRM